MRIVAGTLRGRPLVAPKGHSTRPTADRTRQAVFNVLEHAAWAPDLEGARVIDLFAGSGAMGLEAISRGAAFALFIETDEAARAAIRANAASLGVTGQARIERRDATQLAPRAGGDGAPFQLAFLDPPYREDLADAALARLAEGDWLAEDAIVVVERGGRSLPAVPVGFERLSEREWGAAKVEFLARSKSLL